MILTQRNGSPSWPHLCPDAELPVVHGVAARALKDARQSDDPVLGQEALAWLWVCCPDLADELGLPPPAASVDAEATNYLERLAIWE
jgi:hypothetical protein